MPATESASKRGSVVLHIFGYLLNCFLPHVIANHCIEFFTNQTALVYILTNVWQPFNATASSLSPSLVYLNNPLQSCMISSLQMNFEQGDRSTAQLAWSNWGQNVRVCIPKLFAVLFCRRWSRKAFITCSTENDQGFIFGYGYTDTPLVTLTLLGKIFVHWHPTLFILYSTPSSSLISNKSSYLFFFASICDCFIYVAAMPLVPPENLLAYLGTTLPSLLAGADVCIPYSPYSFR